MKKPAKKMTQYDHLKIEKKWQGTWDKKKTYKTLSAKNAKGKKPFYVLDMFPYPSGAGLHVGHPRGYIASDVLSRMKRMQNFNVLHPMGYDAFGLPAEQYALDHKIHPRKAVEINVKTFEKQLSIIGLSYDWSRKVNTTDPEYYKWTQWIFLQLYNSYYDEKKEKARPISELIIILEKTDSVWQKADELERQEILMNYRLAYLGEAEVNWCPKLGTVLANDEIVDSADGPVSERGGYPVEKMRIKQWFMRITAYADRLLSGLEDLKWSSHLKEIQKNWIGRSEGSLIPFALSLGDLNKNSGGKSDENNKIEVFTTRADTLFGVTYVVLSPENKLVEKLLPNTKNAEAIKKYVKESAKKTSVDRTDATKEKTGVPLVGIFAINPANNEKVPVWIADYVLNDYGTGAVMAVPAHDERDYDFAKKYNLPIKLVVAEQINILNSQSQISWINASEINEDIVLSSEQELSIIETNIRYQEKSRKSALSWSGILVNSKQFNGLRSSIAKQKITEFVGGEIVTKYKMRDAVFARQRYWGEPIPLYRDESGLIHEVTKLPLTLPEVKSYEPTGKAEGPLAGVKAWTDKGLETNTMPGWAGSSWYFLRYMDPKNKKAIASKDELKYWKNVDVYVGGAEHATGHLLYSRFWNKFLYDIGVAETDEPFPELHNQGMILGDDNRKMSKRWGNVVNPDDVVKNYGADSFRLFEMFIGPFFSQLPWSTDGIIGARRFIEKVWKIAHKVLENENSSEKSSPEILKSLHKTIKKVTEDIESFNFNTAVSAMMILTNEMEKIGNEKTGNQNSADENISVEDFKKFLQILAPFAPHATEELWAEFGEKKSINQSTWPKYDPKLIIDDTVTIAVQINGKTRGTILIAKDADQKDIESMAKIHSDVARHLGEREVVKVINVPNRLINFVVKE